MQNRMTQIIAGAGVLLLLAGCKKDEVQVYRVAKDQAAPPLDAAAMGGSTLPAGHPDIGATMPAAESAAAPLTWKTPDGWNEVPPTELRLASFKVNKDGKMVDISVIPLGGMAGTDMSNVNRWRGQVGLSAISADDIQKAAEAVEAGGQPAQLYDVVGTNPASGDKIRIVAVIQHRSDSTWFFKMNGDGDLTEQQKPAFLEFLKSLKFSNTAVPSGMPAAGGSTMPPGHPAIGDMGGAAPSGPISHEGQPNWQVPAGWQEVSGGQFLVAKFMLSGNGGAQAAVNVSSSAGDGGGMMANVNRWRGQLGLQPGDSLMTTPIDLAGGSKAQSVELTGTNPQSGKPTKLVGIVVTQGDRTWFYKLMGDASVVDVQKDAFVKFVQGVKY